MTVSINGILRHWRLAAAYLASNDLNPVEIRFDIVSNALDPLG
ncbi:MAG: hypothetical protein Q4A93_04680 [Actinomycetota bacterium]|nr:hypothetical protein [Actinomycetota bacterium]